MSCWKSKCSCLFTGSFLLGHNKITLTPITSLNPCYSGTPCCTSKWYCFLAQFPARFATSLSSLTCVNTSQCYRRCSSVISQSFICQIFIACCTLSSARSSFPAHLTAHLSRKWYAPKLVVSGKLFQPSLKFTVCWFFRAGSAATLSTARGWLCFAKVRRSAC